jgi:hypothetical protein
MNLRIIPHLKQFKAYSLKLDIFNVAKDIMCDVINLFK